MPERDGARADAGSYADRRARMQAAGGFLIRGSHVTVRIWRACARGSRPVSATPSTRSEQFALRHDSVKKIAACRMHRRRPYPTGHPRERGTAPRELAKAAASIAVDVGRVLVSREDADPALGSARCDLLFLALRGSRRLRGRARRLVAVTAIEVGVGQAHVASLIRAGTRVPLPWGLRSVRPGRITAVDVRVDVGLRIRRRHADDHRQNAQPTDQSLLHHSSSLWTRKCHTFYW